MRLQEVYMRGGKIPIFEDGLTPIILDGPDDHIENAYIEGVELIPVKSILIHASIFQGGNIKITNILSLPEEERKRIAAESAKIKYCHFKNCRMLSDECYGLDVLIDGKPQSSTPTARKQE